MEPSCVPSWVAGPRDCSPFVAPRILSDHPIRVKIDDVDCLAERKQGLDLEKIPSILKESNQEKNMKSWTFDLIVHH